MFNVKLPLAEIFKNPTIRELSEYIKRIKKDKFEALKVTELKDYYKLSSAQKRLYIVEQTGEPSTNYNISMILVIEGDINHSRFEETFKKLISRHESLRTSFYIIEDEPMQKIHDHVEFEIEYYEVEGGNPHSPQYIIKNFIRPFDLSQVPLLKVGLINVGDTKHIFIVDIHHIVTDGTSMEILAKEFMALYGGEELSELSIQYKDFSEWQNKMSQSSEIKREEEHWLKQFEGDIPILELPTDFERPTTQNFKGNTVSFEIGREETDLLNKLALEEGVTLYMLLLAIYNVFLSKLSNQEVIIIGTSVAGRRHADLEPVIGMFVNSLCLRNFPEGGKIFSEFLKDVKQRTLESFENQDYQFEDLVEKLTVERFPNRNPLFSVSFSFHNEMQSSGISEIEIPGLKLTPYDGFDVTTSNFDFTLRGIEMDGKLFFAFQYSTGLYEEETIEIYIEYFKRIVSCVIENPGQKIYDMKIISESQKEDILSQMFVDLEDE